MPDQKIKDYFYDCCSEKEKKEVEQWFVDNAKNKNLDSVLIDILKSCPSDDPELAHKAFISFCERNRILRRKNGKREWLRYLPKIAAALIVSVLSMALIYQYHQNSSVEWFEAYAPKGRSVQVELPDASNIWLKPGSVLVYPDKFNAKKREVYLTGEAYAEIAKDRRHPFILSANGIKVNVLGTKFNVKSYTEDSEVEVALLEGSVRLESSLANQKDTTNLTPGDIVKIDKGTGKKTMYEFDAGFIKSAKTGNNLYFLDKKFKDIALQLERKFNVNIVIEDPSLGEEVYCSIFVNNESINQILSDINSHGIMNVRYSGNNVLISKK